MNDVMSQSRLYRKLVPSKAKLVASAAISTLMALIVGVGGGLSVMLVKEQQSAWDMLMLCGFLVIFLGILLFIGIRGFKRQVKQEGTLQGWSNLTLRICWLWKAR